MKSALSRVGLAAKRRIVADILNTFVCKQCTAIFVRSVNRRSPSKGDEGKQYCSRECAFEAKSAPDSVCTHPPTPRQLNCVVCGINMRFLGQPKLTCSAECDISRQRLIRSQRKDLSPKECKECRCAFVAHYGDKRNHYCSKLCSRKAARRRHKLRYGKNHRDRARNFDVPYEPINIKSVFEAAGYRCQVCGVSTPQRLRGTTNARAPELDHIVPFAMGGGHVRSNVQCCCRSCNAMKHGHLVVGQSLLDFGEKI